MGLLHSSQILTNLSGDTQVLQTFTTSSNVVGVNISGITQTTSSDDTPTTWTGSYQDTSFLTAVGNQNITHVNAEPDVTTSYGHIVYTLETSEGNLSGGDELDVLVSTREVNDQGQVWFHYQFEKIHRVNLDEHYLVHYNSSTNSFTNVPITNGFVENERHALADINVEPSDLYISNNFVVHNNKGLPGGLPYIHFQHCENLTNLFTDPQTNLIFGSVVTLSTHAGCWEVISDTDICS